MVWATRSTRSSMGCGRAPDRGAYASPAAGGGGGRSARGGTVGGGSLDRRVSMGLMQRPWHKSIESDVTPTRARRLRSESSPPERYLWSRLRARKLGGLRFRRQHPLGPFVGDSYCQEAALAVEIDRMCHGGRGLRDNARDEWMRGRWIDVLRFAADQVFRDTALVLNAILSLAHRRCEGPPSDGSPPRTATSPAGGGGGINATRGGQAE